MSLVDERELAEKSVQKRAELGTEASQNDVARLGNAVGKNELKHAGIQRRRVCIVTYHCTPADGTRLRTSPLIMRELRCRMNGQASVASLNKSGS